ncbi:hypothetical protein LOTGIDRAFT_166372 [Lottia gigantea]|uniref:GRAM domain-containing protein n=1 Tax=Lottia gigantea TaxID=225164 RepID=V3ZXY9_LOTGI|nr:hypothetical protein LOTGIDRAFT_166372 [Lottia gigantea]ESO87495.1 hypothetical protein LOTGIDRAFT_166372 [Lottia gigantea]
MAAEDSTPKHGKSTPRVLSAKRRTVEFLRTFGIFSHRPQDRKDDDDHDYKEKPIQRSRTLDVKKVFWRNDMEIRRVNSDRFTRRNNKSEHGSHAQTSRARKSLPTISTLSTSSGGGGDKSPVFNGNDVCDLLAPKTESDVSRNVSPNMNTRKPTNGHIDFFYPSVSKSRNEQFHKLFQSVPEDEFPIDYFSCAFKGDILLQGLMYVSPNWICFYSKIKGRGRQVEIPFSDIICITREKTALVFPNAIGIQTADTKVVFGSFMSRDSTYRLLENLWKQSHDSEKESTLISANDYRKSDKCSSLSESCSSFDVEQEVDNSSETDSDVCLKCGSVNMKTEPTRPSDKKTCLTCESNNNVDQKPSRIDRIPFFYIVKCFDCTEPYKAFCRLKVRLQHIPRTNLLLTVCSILVFFLLLSAVGLTYKILVIQARLEMASMWTPQTKLLFRDHMMDEAYKVQRESHESTINHLHTVIKANIHLLQEVHDSLRSLQSQVHDTCQTKDCP